MCDLRLCDGAYRLLLKLSQKSIEFILYTFIYRGDRANPSTGGAGAWCHYLPPRNAQRRVELGDNDLWGGKGGSKKVKEYCVQYTNLARECCSVQLALAINTGLVLPLYVQDLLH